MEHLLNALKAAGESTRLRLLGLLARNDLTVSELTQILGQSQPRISRHLKLLTDAGLIERHQEGTWAFFRLSDEGAAGKIGRALIDMIPVDDEVFGRDCVRLEAVRHSRAEAAAAYFRHNAEQWGRIRSLHVDDAQIEAAMLAAVGEREIDNLLDLGTGTGRILQVFSHRITQGLGIDVSREMLAFARANLDEMGLRHCRLRQADIYALPLPAHSVDVVTIHQVLHYLDDPASAIIEASRALRRGGHLLIVDFAPHSLEFLRHECAHRRLGFGDTEVTHWCELAGLEMLSAAHFAPSRENADQQLTVTLWVGQQNQQAPRQPSFGDRLNEQQSTF